MKNRMIIKLLVMIYTVYARLELCDIKEIEENIFAARLENIFINPDGPLNPLRGYIFYKNELLYNKRFFSPGIRADYSLNRYRDLRENVPEYKYKFRRNPENDTPYRNNNGIDGFNTELEYLSDFHQKMIYMFPCVNGMISIEPHKNNSFTRFLRKHSSKPGTIYLLATLILLSEGVDVPIEVDKSIEGSERIVLKNENFVFVDLPLQLESIVADKSKKKIYQKETEEIVLFFKNLCREPFLSEVKKREEPDSQGEFYSGDFLDSPKFLIQSYIFEYIDSIEQYRKLIAAVRVFLIDLELYPGISEYQKEHINKTINRCFIENNPDNSIKNTYAADIYSLKTKIDNEAILPFICYTMVPSYTRIPENIPENSQDPIKDEILQYANHVETMLLNLFMCLTYNPETNKCSTEYMHGASTALIEFFNKYSVPTENASQTKHRDWCKVVSRLNNPNIRYAKESRTMLHAGLENILYVICELFPLNHAMRNTIVNTIHISRNTGLERTKKLEELFLNILNRCLAGNHQISISTSILAPLSENRQSIDVFGSITLVFERNNKKERIELITFPVMSRFTLLSDFRDYSEDIKNELMGLKEKYSGINKYTGNIISNYLNNTLESHKKKTLEQNLGMLNNILKNENIQNRLFLYGYGDIDYKAAIINYFCITNRNRVRDNQLLCIIINIIGNTLIPNLETRKKILPQIMYFTEHKEHFSNIEYDLENMPTAEISNDLLNNIVESMIYINHSKEAFLEYFSYFLKKSIYYKQELKIFGVLDSFKAIFIKVPEKYEFGILTEIMQKMKECMESNAVTSLNNIWFAWLCYACMNINNPMFINFIYAYLDPMRVSNEYILRNAIKLKNISKKILSALEKEKESLCNGNDPVSKKKYDKLTSIFKSQLITEIGGLSLSEMPSRKRIYCGQRTHKE
ncbi:hypothetical protein NEPAR06_2017 [Nematocida parisii]|nr:hypothetical protein NEPAR06_2017 [Nematocida parisii]